MQNPMLSKRVNLEHFFRGSLDNDSAKTSLC